MVKEFARRHHNRVQPEPEASQPAVSMTRSQVLNTLWGPHDASVTGAGTLKDYDRTARADEIMVPTLFICGRYDICTPEETARYHSLVAGSEMVIFEQSSHAPYVEDREHFMQVVRDFLRCVDARLGE